MDVSLKARRQKNDKCILPSDILYADPNTRYRYSVRTIAENRCAYTFFKDGKPFYYDDDSGHMVYLIFPVKEACEYCINNSKLFDGADAVRVSQEELYHDILPRLYEREVLVSVFLNLRDVIEIPALEFKIDWFGYMFYEMELDWMFDE